MNKKRSYYWHVLLAGVATLLLFGCGTATQISTPIPRWQPIPTYVHYIPSSDLSEYKHYTPSEAFIFNLEFDYPSYWWLKEKKDEIGMLNILLGDPRFLTLPTPTDDIHPTPNDFGSVFIWIMPSEPGQTPDVELTLHKQAYSEIHWMKVLSDYKIMIDGQDASVLEYQVNDQETSPSLMFYRRTYFMVKGQVYEIIYSVAEKDRGGDFDKGYEYFLNSLKIVP